MSGLDAAQYTGILVLSFGVRGRSARKHVRTYRIWWGVRSLGENVIYRLQFRPDRGPEDNVRRPGHGLASLHGSGSRLTPGFPEAARSGARNVHDPTRSSREA